MPPTIFESRRQLAGCPPRQVTAGGSLGPIRQRCELLLLEEADLTREAQGLGWIAGANRLNQLPAKVRFRRRRLLEPAHHGEGHGMLADAGPGRESFLVILPLPKLHVAPRERDLHRLAVAQVPDQ